MGILTPIKVYTKFGLGVKIRAKGRTTHKMREQGDIYIFT